MTNNTIAAVATPTGEGGISVIRVSGPDSITCVSRIFSAGKKLINAASHTVHYGFIIDPSNGNKIDEVLVTLMRAPRSFTMEDVVEVSCHGGIISVKKVLELILDTGVGLAEPGEFTKRAFLNGRIDLSQAEAVIDLIRSKSERAFSIAMKQSEGTLSKKIQGIRHQLVETMAHIEVNIDYPEHDVEALTNAYIKDQCESAIDQVEQLLLTAEQGKLLREGISTVIVGKPNVGKSSLLNTLAQENRAIVTDIPGTTRDVIEQYVNIRGIPLNLMDTAGIRETSDVVEQIGVERSRNALTTADLVLLVLNYNSELEEDELALMEQLKDRNTIVLVNKTDLPQNLNLDQVYRVFAEQQVIMMSIKKEEGLQKLEGEYFRNVFEGKLESDDYTYVSNVRHIHLLKRAKEALIESYRAADEEVPIDMIQIDLRNAWELLGEIIGDAVSDSLIDQIFSQFCLGK